MKKFLSVLLVVITLLSIIPGTILSVSAATIDNEAFNAKITELKKVFRDGEYWNAYNSVKYEGTGTKKCPCTGCCNNCACKCGQFYYDGKWYAGQCYGWAQKIGHLIFGGIPSHDWTKHYNAANLKPGDIVRGDLSSYNKYWTNHAIIVTAVTGNKVTFADCNSSGACQVKWGRTTTIAVIKEAVADKGAFILHAKNSTTTASDAPVIKYSTITAGEYYLKNVGTGKYLTVDGGKDVNKTNVKVAAKAETKAFKMKITAATTGYKIRPLCCASRLVNPFADIVSNGVNVNIYTDSKDPSQWWRFEKTDKGYIIHNTQNPDCVLTANSSNNVLVSTNKKTDSQIWILECVGEHNYKTTTTKATADANGKKVTACTLCGKVKTTTVIYKPETFTLSATSYKYSGSAKKPTVTVKDSQGNTLIKDTDYTLTYATGRVKPGKYKITVNFTGKYSGSKQLFFNIKPLAPAKVNVASRSTSYIKLSWPEAVGATGYRIYKYDSATGTYKTVATTTNLSYTIKSLSSATNYKFAIKSYTELSDGSRIWSGRRAITTSSRPIAPLINSAVSYGKGKITIKWNDVARESGYKIYYSTTANGTYKLLRTLNPNDVSETCTGLTSGKTYYFKVRAFKTVNGTKIYSSYSPAKAAKIK